MSQTKNKQGTVGRPAGKDKDSVREDLLRAAREHFMKRDFKAVSLREIANSAGVNGAMVNYYFGGKKGLYLAMVEEVFSALELQAKELDSGGDFSVADFSRGYSQMLAQNPWWPNFFVREILFSEGEAREDVLRRISSLIAPNLLQSIKQEIGSGHYREELKPELTILSLLAMTVFPFLAAPMVERILGMKVNEETVDLLATHNIDIFMHGVLAEGQQPNGGPA